MAADLITLAREALEGDLRAKVEAETVEAIAAWLDREADDYAYEYDVQEWASALAVAAAGIRVGKWRKL